MMLTIACLNTHGYYATAESTYTIVGPVADKTLETLLRRWIGLWPRLMWHHATVQGDTCGNKQRIRESSVRSVVGGLSKIDAQETIGNTNCTVGQ